MGSVNFINRQTATPEQIALVDTFQAKLGRVPRFMQAFAESPAAVCAFQKLYAIAGGRNPDELHDKPARCAARHHGPSGLGFSDSDLVEIINQVGHHCLSQIRQ